MKYIKKGDILAILIVFFLINTSYSQNAFKPGTPAPAISIAEWLNGKPDSKDFLNGKTIILEFWGTWCRPCIKSIPHINELVKKFKSDSVIFISISQEDSKKVANFLKKKKINAFVAIDANGKTNKNYKIRYIPRAYIIDSFGNIVWEGHPAGITDSLLDMIINKKHIKRQINN